MFHIGFFKYQNTPCEAKRNFKNQSPISFPSKSFSMRIRLYIKKFIHFYPKSLAFTAWHIIYKNCWDERMHNETKNDLQSLGHFIFLTCDKYFCRYLQNDIWLKSRSNLNWRTLSSNLMYELGYFNANAAEWRSNFSKLEKSVRPILCQINIICLNKNMLLPLFQYVESSYHAPGAL